MKNHPCIKEAKRIIKNAGINAMQTGTLEFRVITPTFNEKPLFIDIRCSAIEDGKARFEVCWLSDNHSEFAEVSTKLHHLVFTF